MAAKEMPTLTRSGFCELKSSLSRELLGVLNSIEQIGVPPKDTDVWDKVLPIDSKLVATKLRPIVKKYLGARFPLKFIRKGGYKSPEEVLEHLMPQLLDWCPEDRTEHAVEDINGATFVTEAC